MNLPEAMGYEHHHISTPEITEGLKSRFDTVQISESEKRYLIPPLIHGHQEEMATRGNQHDGISQHLRAVIRDGDSFYSIIDLMAVFRDSSDKVDVVYEDVIVTRRTPNSDIEQLGFVGDEGAILVGPNTVHNTDGKIPKGIFSIVESSDGTVGIVNHNSDSNLEMYFSRQSRPQDELLGLSLMDSYNPVENPNFWSMDLRSTTQIDKLM